MRMRPSRSNEYAAYDMLIYIAALIIAVPLEALFVKWGWNVGMDDVARHLALSFHRVGYATAFHMTIMLWFLGGALVGLNTMLLARKSDVR